MRGLRLGVVTGSLLLGARLSAAEAPAPGSLLVVDNPTRSVISIDPTTGSQTVVTSGNLIADAQGLAVNESTGEIFVVNALAPQSLDVDVVRIDPLTTQQSVVASGNDLFSPSGSTG